jgi:hypothetical protein
VNLQIGRVALLREEKEKCKILSKESYPGTDFAFCIFFCISSQSLLN